MKEREEAQSLEQDIIIGRVSRDNNTLCAQDVPLWISRNEKQASQPNASWFCSSHHVVSLKMSPYP
jgi:hypothetical protein